ncbi:unnamed protein product [Effrenium voratum]|nr:unnamed protein product [Effrenium voratum]
MLEYVAPAFPALRPVALPGATSHEAEGWGLERVLVRCHGQQGVFQRLPCVVLHGLRCTAGETKDCQLAGRAPMALGQSLSLGRSSGPWQSRGSSTSAKSGRQAPDSRRSLRPAPLRGLVRELSPGLAQVQLCWDGGQASPFFGSLRQMARLLKGQEVSVHILPLDEPGLQLRLTDEGALTGTSLRKGPGQPADQKSPGAVPKKRDRAVERVNWIDAEPLPYLLCGAVAPCVRASVLAASAEKAEARLFWDSPLGEQLSPLVATISAEAVQEVFNLTNVKCSDYLHENQPVSLALSGQRLGLLTFLIALHLQRLPNAPPTPPAVLFLGAGAGVRLSRFCGRKTEERTEEHWKQVEAQTLAGSPSEVLAKVNGDGYLLSRVSLVVVEMPIAGRQQKELKALLARLPAGRWPSILWQREDSDCGLEELLVDRPARLHLANALYGAKERVQVVSDHLPSVALAARRLPRQSVVIFAKAKDSSGLSSAKHCPLQSWRSPGCGFWSPRRRWKAWWT